MSKMGKINESPEKKKGVFYTIKHSFIYRLIKRLLSILSTLMLVCILFLGAVMFYYNSKAKAAQQQGISYTAPFGLYTIISGSMEPNIHVYDVVVALEPQDLSSIKVGDVITFISSWDLNYGTTVTHRVVDVAKTASGEYQFSTKGDNNQSADGAVVTKDNLIGKVILRIPQLGRLQFFIATKMGWFIVVFIPALGIIIMDLIKILKLRVLKDQISEIKDVEEADKTYFGSEHLDGRDLGESELNKTRVINVSKEEIEDIIDKDYDDYEQEETERKPLKTRRKIK